MCLICVGAGMPCHVMKAEVKGQLCEVSSLCPCLCGFWGLNSGLQTCAASAFIPKPSYQLSVLSFLNKSIYMYVCVCFMFTCELIHTPTCVLKEARNQPWVSLPLTEGFLLAWSFPVRPEWLTRTFREFLYLPNAGLTIIHHAWAFFMGFRDQSQVLVFTRQSLFWPNYLFSQNWWF